MNDHSPATDLHRFRQIQAGRYAPDSTPASAALLGASPAMERLRAQVAAAAASGGNSLVVGNEPGQLLEIAEAIHYRAHPDGTAALVRIDAVLALPGEMRRGINTLLGEGGARGTLLVESVSRLPAEQQAELLTAVADSGWAAQIIATSTSEAWNLGISDQLAAMLSTLTLEVPRLTDRPEDIPQLVAWYIEARNRDSQHEVASIGDEALDRLVLYDWPGELAELQEAIASAHARCRGRQITPSDLPSVLNHAVEQARKTVEPPEPIDLDAYLSDVETLLVERALELARGNKAEAARLLGVSRPRLYRKLEQMGVVEPPPKKPKEKSKPPPQPEEPPPAPDDIEFFPIDGE